MSKKETKKKRPLFTEFTLDMFSRSSGRSHSEIKQFNQWRDEIIEADKYTFETPHLTPQTPTRPTAHPPWPTDSRFPTQTPGAHPGCRNRSPASRSSTPCFSSTQAPSSPHDAIPPRIT